MHLRDRGQGSKDKGRGKRLRGIREGWHWRQAAGLDASEGREPKEVGLKARGQGCKEESSESCGSECERNVLGMGNPKFRVVPVDWYWDQSTGGEHRSILCPKWLGSVDWSWDQSTDR